MDETNRRNFLKDGLKFGTAVVGMSILTELAASSFNKNSGIARAAGLEPEHEIYAFKYGGTLQRKMAIFMWNTGYDQDAPINYYVWAIKAKNGEVTVVDTGASPALGAARKVPGYTDPIEVLARLDINATNVTRVVITHGHWDHIGNIDGFAKTFPKAKFYVQKREFDFLVKSPLVERKPIAFLFDPPANRVLAELAGAGRLAIIDGDYKLAPGLDLLLAPGHTLGLQVVRVNTASGPAIVGSDLAHMFRGIEENIGSTFVMDMPAWIQSFDKVKSQAAIGKIFPGHDIAMSENYPTVAKDVTRLV